MLGVAVKGPAKTTCSVIAVTGTMSCGRELVKGRSWLGVPWKVLDTFIPACISSPQL